MRLFSNDTPRTPLANLGQRPGIRFFRAARIALVIILLALIATGPGLSQIIAQWGLALIGVGGALVANATGIGGGIVFVPAFDRLGLDPGDIVGTSLIIQSFGMTMGGLSYLARRTAHPRADGLDNSAYRMIILLTALPAALGAWLATKGGIRPDLPLATIFKVISVSLVLLILGSELMPKPDADARRITWARDALPLVVIGLVGGLFVGWISIGVGEVLAVYLLLRGERGRDAIGLAVIVTSVTVLLTLMSTGFSLSADLDTALLVAPGALVGGFLAPYVLHLVGQARVKWFCAAFIVLSALVV